MREQQNAERARKNQERREREQREKEAKAWAMKYYLLMMLNLFIWENKQVVKN